jgi:stage V sporulation protein R
MLTPLPHQIAEYAEKIAEFAREEGLSFFPTIFEMLDYEQMTQVAAYGGFPQRYPHWRFGMEYERLRKSQRYGLSKIYEMVINNDPCYAYLLADNTMTDHKTVIAHVYGHCDFFKNNVCFAQTNRRMVDQMANHATRVRRHIDRYGFDVVEQFLDTCLSLEDLIDPHSKFMRRRPARGEAPAERVDDAVRYPAKRYMDRYINPPERLAAQRKAAEEERERGRHRFPEAPERDVLLFLLEHAPLEDWQADILSIVREEAYYYAPQGQTKIMNEGWATYWHSTLMTRYILRDDELVTYCDHHAGTLASSPGQMNCTDLVARRNWGKDREIPERVVGRGSAGREKIYQVRKIYNDVTFIDEFLTPEFVDKHKLYHYRFDPATQRLVVVNRDFEKIKRQILFGLTNHARPYVYVVDGNYANRGELFLAHEHIGVDLDIRYATETLRSVQELWGRPVHLIAVIDDEPVLFSFDGEQAEQQKWTDDMPEPAHAVIVTE